jgi:hypothetical protein
VVVLLSGRGIFSRLARELSDILSVITLIFGEVRSGLEYDPAGRLFLPRFSCAKDTAYSAQRMYPEPDLSPVAVNDSTHLKTLALPLWSRRCASWN